mmetsp:Transcript_30613/g.64659  ORF Transcript_30613/g.64659 Transcript_30613/m.64659 type:complete len:92 (+) Transcript_30613:1560-1835(+)
MQRQRRRQCSIQDAKTTAALMPSSMPLEKKHHTCLQLPMERKSYVRGRRRNTFCRIALALVARSFRNGRCHGDYRGCGLDQQCSRGKIIEE